MSQPATVVVESHAEFVVQHAGAKLARWLDSQLQYSESAAAKNAIVIGTAQDGHITAISQGCPGMLEELKKVGREGFLIRTVEQAIVIAGNSANGAANGAYAMLRDLRKASSRNPFGQAWALVDKPHFEYRGTWIFSTTWELTKLTVDTWIIDDWKKHIDFLRELCVNRMDVVVMAKHFYHPDYEETWQNKWRYEVWHQAFEYAQKQGIKPVFVFTNNPVPSSVWWKSKHRGIISAYAGMILCWNKEKEAIIPFHKFNIDYFEDVVDGFEVYFDDPGLCNCKDQECLDRSVGILDSFDALLKMVPGNSRLDLCTHNLRQLNDDSINDGYGDFLEPLLEKLPEDSVVIDLGGSFQEYLEGNERFARLRDVCINCFYMLDPEGGRENMTIFPDPKSELIEKEMELSVQQGRAGLLGGRQTPFTGVISEYLCYRKAWAPKLPMNDAIEEVAGLLATTETNKAKVRDSIFLLNEWFLTKKKEALLEARGNFDFLRRAEKSADSERISILADCVEVLVLMQERVLSMNTPSEGDESFEEFVARVFIRMNDMWIFQAYSTDPFWTGRSQELLIPRVKWWLRHLFDVVLVY